MLDTVYIYQMPIKNKSDNLVDLSGYMIMSQGIPMSNKLRIMARQSLYAAIADHIYTGIKGSPELLEKYDLFPLSDGDVICLVDSAYPAHNVMLQADTGRWFRLYYEPVHNKLVKGEVI